MTESASLDLNSLKLHLWKTLDNEPDHPTAQIVPPDAFISAYYAIHRELHGELRSILAKDMTNPLLVLGRAGTGKTTILYAILSELSVDEDAPRPFVRVPFLRKDARLQELAGESKRLLEEAILAQVFRSIRSNLGLEPYNAWFEYFAQLMSRSADVRANADDIERFRTSFYPLQLEFGLDAPVGSELNAAQREIFSFAGRASVKAWLEMYTYLTSAGRASYCHLLIDNIENAEAIQAVQVAREALRELHITLGNSCRLILSMRYTSVSKLSDLRGVVVAAEAGKAPEEIEQVNVGAVVYEVFHLPGKPSVSMRRFKEIALEVLTKRIQNFEHELLLSADSEVLSVLRHLMADSHVIEVVAGAANFNLRDMFSALSNLTENFLDFEFKIDELPMPGSSNREREDPMVTFLYSELSSKGISKLVGREHAKSSREEAVRAVFQFPLWRTGKVAQRACFISRLVLSIVHSKSYVNQDLARGQAPVSYDEIVRLSARFGISSDDVGAALVDLSGDSQIAGYIESASERFGIFSSPASDTSYTILPKGVIFLRHVEWRFGFWLGAIDFGREEGIESFLGGKARSLIRVFTRVLDEIYRFGKLEILEFGISSKFSSSEALREEYSRLVLANEHKLIALRALRSMVTFWEGTAFAKHPEIYGLWPEFLGLAESVDQSLTEFWNAGRNPFEPAAGSDELVRDLNKMAQRTAP